MGIGPLIAWRRASLRSLGRTSAGRSASRSPRASALLAARRRLLDPGPPRVHVRRLRARLDRARARPRDAGPPRARRRRLGSPRSARSSPPTGAATAATSCTRRSSCWRSASRARAPTRRARGPAGDRARRCAWATTRSRLRGVETRRAANATEVRAVLDVSRDGRSLGTLAPGKNLYPVEEQTSNEVGDPQRPPDRRGPVRDRRRAPPAAGSRLPQGLRQAARQPDLARRARLPRRRADRHVARRARGAPARGAVRRHPPRARRDRASRSRSARRWPSCASSSSRARSSASPSPADDRLDELGELDRRRAELEEERDRALAALKELEYDHRTGAVSDDDYRALVGPLRRRGGRRRCGRSSRARRVCAPPGRRRSCAP